MLEKIEMKNYGQSAIDGRYKNKLSELEELVSESALIKYRIKVEILWLLHLNNVNKANHFLNISINSELQKS